MTLTEELIILIKHEFKNISIDLTNNNEADYLSIRVEIFETLKRLINSLFDEYSEVVSLKMFNKGTEEATKYSEYFNVILVDNKYVIEYQICTDEKSNIMYPEVTAISAE